jgi:hypothetical protein
MSRKKWGWARGVDILIFFLYYDIVYKIFLYSIIV